MTQINLKSSLSVAKGKLIEEQFKSLSTQVNVAQGNIKILLEENQELSGKYSDLSQNYEQTIDKYNSINETITSHTQLIGEHSSTIDEISKTVESQNSKIEQTQTAITQKVWKDDITSSLDGVTQRLSSAESSIEQTQSSISSKVWQTDIDSATDNINGTISTLSQQTSDKFSWLIKSGSSSTNFTLTDRAISLVSNKIDLSGYVTISALAKAGTTTIDGSNIKTGHISSSNYVENDQGTSINLIDGSISTKNFKVSDEGVITATSGTIGGFTITDKIIYSNTNEKSIGISPYRSYQNCIWVGETNGKLGQSGTNATFRVEGSGRVHATDADITGGSIGGFTLDDNKLYSNSTYNIGLSPYKPYQYCLWIGETNGKKGGSDTNAPFKVEGSGKVTATNMVFAGGGIGGFTVTPTNIIRSFDGANGMGLLGESTNDNIAFYAGSDTKSIGTAPFRVKYDGTLYCKKIETTGTMFVKNLSPQNSLNLYWTGSSLVARIDVTDIGYISVTASDKRLKNDIEPMSLEFAQNLVLNLTPHRYRLNSEGISGLKHCGFIAQEVDEILQSKGYKRSDFGGFQIDTKGNDEYDELYWLKYEEFVAPAIRVIQDHEKRIKDLEKQIIELKS